jgi:phosphoesterase RecJ-like protein
MPNYKESKLILKEVKKAERILVNCHAGADPDSVSSAASLAYVLNKLKKKVTVAAPDSVSERYDFIYPTKKISTLDFEKIDYREYDLFFVIDSEQWQRVHRNSRTKNITVINIDHHPKNDITGDIEILNPSSGSTTQILYSIFQDWNIEIDKQLATELLIGIYSDTGFFQFANTNPEALKIAGELLRKGADFNNIVLNLKRRQSLDLVKMWGEIATRARVDKKYRFSWSALPYSIFKEYNVHNISPTSEATDMFLRVIEGVNFALCMVEKKEKKLHMSLRARITGFDVSKIARELGGGGHKDASGASIEGLPFDSAVKKALSVARKYAKSR